MHNSGGLVRERRILTLEWVSPLFSFFLFFFGLSSLQVVYGSV